MRINRIFNPSTGSLTRFNDESRQEEAEYLVNEKKIEIINFLSIKNHFEMFYHALAGNVEDKKGLLRIMKDFGVMQPFLVR